MRRAAAPLDAHGHYLLSLFLAALSPLLERELIPVVVPDFILLCFTLPDFILEWVVVAPGPTLPSLDAPGAGCVCADAIAVAPNSEATARAEIASLDRMRNLLLWMNGTGVRTCELDLGSGPHGGFSRADERAHPPLHAAGTPRLWTELTEVTPKQFDTVSLRK
jgi:hypothetical protein